MSPLVSTRKVVQGRPSKKQVKRNERKAERGVCRIRICCSGDQGYETVGCGILIKYKIQQWKSKYLIATTDRVFQGGFDAKYRVDFIRSKSRLKTFMLDHKWIAHHADSGMIVIALDPHSPVFRRGLKRSSVITHRPFEVKLFDNEDNAFEDGLCVHVVADAHSELFGVKPHELIRDTTGYILRNFNPVTCKPFGGAILRRVDKKWTAVGVLNCSTTSEDRFLPRPIWLSEAVFSNLKSGPPQKDHQHGSCGNAADPSTSSAGPPQQDNQDGSSGNAMNPSTSSTGHGQQDNQDHGSSGNAANPSTSSTGPPQQDNQDGSSGNAANPSTSSTGPPQQDNQDGSSGNAANPSTSSTGPPQQDNQDGSSGNAANPSTSSTGPPQQDNQDGSSGNATNQRKEKLSSQDAVVRPPGAIPKKRSTQHRGKLNIEEPYMRWNQQEVINCRSAESLGQEGLHKAYHRNQQNRSNEKEELTTGSVASRFYTEFSQTLGIFARANTTKLPFVTGRSSYILAGSPDTGGTGCPSEQDDDDEDGIIQALLYQDGLMKKQLQAKSISCDMLQNRVSSLEQNYKECKDQCAALQEQNKQLRQRNIGLMSLEADSQEMIGKLQKMLHWKQEECHQWQEECHQKEEECHQLQEMLHWKQGECRQWQEECHQLREQLTTLRREVEELRENVRLQGPEWASIGNGSAHDSAHSDCSSVSSGSASGELRDRDSSDLGD